jgi:hypothetical protein
VFSDDEDNDDYGFITKMPPPIPPPVIPELPLEYQYEYQKRLKEYQNKVYWESIKRQLTDYYSNHQNNHQYEFRRERMASGRRGSLEEINKTAMETTIGTNNNVPSSTNKLLKNKHNTAAQAVPLQSSYGLDDNWKIGAGRRDSGSTSDLLDQVCEVQDCCERFQDFENDTGDNLRDHLNTPLCVKCLVRYYNTRPVTTTAMSRVSSTFDDYRETNTRRCSNCMKLIRNF